MADIFSSMKTFLTDNFLLTNDTACELFHSCAKGIPIIDYHNHLDVAAIASDKKYQNIGELWVTTDPYKHRAMRINGISEQQVSGNASDKEKFDAWAQTFPNTVGNPLYHWTTLELKRLFGIDELLSSKNKEFIWQQCNRLLQGDGFSTVNILRKWNTEMLCTSDDLLDDVTVHRLATEKAESFVVLPSLRADSILALGTLGFKHWLHRLSAIYPVESLADYLHAVRLRLDAFTAVGCRLSDHALDNGFRFSLPSHDEATKLFVDYLATDSLTAEELVKLKSYLLYILAKEYALRGWVMQLHIGAERFTSSRLRRLAGPAGGYATIGSACDIRSLCQFLDSVEAEGFLPKTILFTLNPADNAAFGTITGSFTADNVWGKIQYGPAWWYNDHKEGMERHLRTLSSYGLLNRFIGMTTDSRSILSFSRHEYFRRILCNYIGEMAEHGEAPADMEFLSELITNISYRNAKAWVIENQ